MVYIASEILAKLYCLNIVLKLLERDKQMNFIFSTKRFKSIRNLLAQHRKIM